MSPEISVHELDVMNDAAWPFDGTSTPRWQHQDYGSVATFDPYPAYAHELQDVVEAAAHVEACCPPLWNVELYVRHGSGGRWHDAVHEIFACDFRIVVCGVEHGFWPHPGVPRPDDVPALAGWWDTAVQSLKAARAVAALAGGSDA